MTAQEEKGISYKLAKLEELAQQHGEHFSYFNKSLVEIKTILEKNAEETKKYRETVDAHMQRVEPVILAYERDQAFKKALDEKGETVVKWSKRITAVGVIGGAVIIAFKKFL